MEEAVKMNTTNISKLQEKLGDGEIEAFRDNLTRSLDDRVEAQIAQLEAATLGRVDGLVTETSNRVAVLENATSSFESWRPRVEHSVDDIRNSMDTLRSYLARLPNSSSATTTPQEIVAAKTASLDHMYQRESTHLLP
jgi:hypothetical protein